MRREAGLNALLITIDTLRADAIGAYGDARAATPWIDRLAGGDVRFARANAHNVVTLPSHSNILSGRHPFGHGVRDNAGFRFPRGTDTLATILKRQGYRTGAFVSAFTLDSRFGLDAGFDVYDDGFAEATRRRLSRCPSVGAPRPSPPPGAGWIRTEAAPTSAGSISTIPMRRTSPRSPTPRGSRMMRTAARSRRPTPPWALSWRAR